MRNDTVRTRIVESSLTLPFMATTTFLLWLMGPVEEGGLWCALVLIGIMTYAIVEWNNQCQLLRIRSRMNSTVFLAFICAFPAFHTSPISFIPAAALLGCYFVLFKGYGQFRPQGYLFHGFLFLGIGSIAFPPLLFLYPTLLISCQRQLRILDFKSFVASLLGIILPFWFWIPAIYIATYFGITDDHLLQFLTFEVPDISGVAPWQWGALALVSLLASIGIIHFVATSYNDKIRTRQYYYCILLQFVPLVASTVMYPQYASTTLPLLFINATPFIAHYLALARGRHMTGMFFFWMAIFITIGTINYFDFWPSLLSFSFSDIQIPDFNLQDIWKSFTN